MKGHWHSEYPSSSRRSEFHVIFPRNLSLPIFFDEAFWVAILRQAPVRVRSSSAIGNASNSIRNAVRFELEKQI